MPLYRSDHVEYNFESGHIQIAMDNGELLPAYWAHPARGTKFPGIALMHNWWGMTDVIRRMAHLFAQHGFYVIIPDMFGGRQPKTHEEALEQVKILGDAAFLRIDAALSVLENHHMCNEEVAAVGVGLGGTLALEAAIRREDLEVAVAFYGFPHKFFGEFAKANTPILAIYGDQDSIIRPVVVNKLRDELAQTPLKDDHKVLIIPGAKHDFIKDKADTTTQQQVSLAWQEMIDFIERYIHPPKKKQGQVY